MNFNWLFYPFIYHIAPVLLIFLIVVLMTSFLTPMVKNNKLSKIIIFSTIIIGLYLRFSLALFSEGNFDLQSYKIVSDLFINGKNIYANTNRYNYSPLWFLILGLFKIFTIKFSLSFIFIVRAFLSLIDLGTLFLLIKFSNIKKISPTKVAIAFFLNPISIILTGHHGQFENFTIFLILLGIYLLLKNKNKFIALSYILLGGILKHNVFNLAVASISFIFKKRLIAAIIVIISILLFLVSFVPYWKEGQENIIANVFMYKSYEGFYGVYTFIKKIGPIADFAKFYRYLFILAYFLFAFFFKTKDILKTILVNSLFFIVFASGMVDQYYILPVAIGLLVGGNFFYIYTLIISLFLFKSSAQLNQQQYFFITDNIVWLTSFLWFVTLIFNLDLDKHLLGKLKSLLRNDAK